VIIYWYERGTEWGRAFQGDESVTGGGGSGGRTRRPPPVSRKPRAQSAERHRRGVRRGARNRPRRPSRWPRPSRRRRGMRSSEETLPRFRPSTTCRWHRLDFLRIPRPPRRAPPCDAWRGRRRDASPPLHPRLLTSLRSLPLPFLPFPLPRCPLCRLVRSSPLRPSLLSVSTSAPLLLRPPPAARPRCFSVPCVAVFPPLPATSLSAFCCSILRTSRACPASCDCPSPSSNTLHYAHS
jgi:hypothetical protein